MPAWSIGNHRLRQRPDVVKVVDPAGGAVYIVIVTVGATMALNPQLQVGAIVRAAGSHRPEFSTAAAQKRLFGLI